MKSSKIVLMIILVCSIQALVAFESTSPGLPPESTGDNTTTTTITTTTANTNSTVNESGLETDDKVNPALLNTLPAVNILNLSGRDSDGEEIQRFRIESLPNAETGTLYLGDARTELGVGQVLTIEESDNIRFDPNEDFEGNAVFTYSSVARNGAVDNTPATVTLPIISADTAETIVEPTVVIPVVGGESTNADCPVHIEDCTCNKYETSVPSLSSFAILLIFLITIIIGKNFIKKEL